MTGESNWLPVVVVLLGLLAVGALWFLAPGRGLMERATKWQSVVCPNSGMTFGLLAARDSSSGPWNDVVSCSRFFPPTKVTCAKACLGQLNGERVILRWTT